MCRGACEKIGVDARHMISSIRNRLEDLPAGASRRDGNVPEKHG